MCSSDLAEVVGVDVDEDCLDQNGKFHLNDTGLIAYSHGEYFSLGEYVGKFGYSVRKNPPAEKPHTAKGNRRNRESERKNRTPEKNAVKSGKRNKSAKQR